MQVNNKVIKNILKFCEDYSVFDKLSEYEDFYSVLKEQLDSFELIDLKDFWDFNSKDISEITSDDWHEIIHEWKYSLPEEDTMSIGLRGFEYSDIVHEFEINVLHQNQKYKVEFDCSAEDACECGGYFSSLEFKKIQIIK